jgi:natural product precursor
MKQKKHSKLSFNKATVTNLNNSQMKGAVGGEFTDPVECPSIHYGTCKPHICDSLECSYAPPC